MLLENKNAVIYGGGGSSGSAVALGGERVTGAHHEGP